MLSETKDARVIMTTPEKSKAAWGVSRVKVDER